MGCGGHWRPGASGDRANADGGEFRMVSPEFSTPIPRGGALLWTPAPTGRARAPSLRAVAGRVFAHAAAGPPRLPPPPIFRQSPFSKKSLLTNHYNVISYNETRLNSIYCEEGTVPVDVGNKLEKGGMPLYLELAQILREQIETGEYKSGDCLPTEKQISKTYGVSLITVREARRTLVDEGLIVRYSGKGTFVVENPSRGAYLAASDIKDFIYAGHAPATRRECVSCKSAPANSRAAEVLRIPVKSKILEVQSLMYIGEAPYGHTASIIPYELGRRIPKERLAEKALILLLSEICTLQIAEVDQLTMASHAEGQIAKVLEMKVGDPVLVVQRIFYDAKRIPVQMTVNTFRPDRFRHHVHVYWSALHLKPRKR